MERRHIMHDPEWFTCCCCRCELDGCKLPFSISLLRLLRLKSTDCEYEAAKHIQTFQYLVYEYIQLFHD